MRVTEKGQVTIPKPIRDRLGIGPGSEVEFVVEEDAVHLVAADEETAHRGSLSRLQRHLEKIRGTVELDTDASEYFEILRGPYDDLDDR